VRVFDTGHGRKTDATDAHSVARVALRTRGLRELVLDHDLTVLRLLADRRDELSRSRNRTLNRLHRLQAELIPAGAPRHLSALQAKALLASVRPRDLAGPALEFTAAVLVRPAEFLHHFVDGDLRGSRQLRDRGSLLLWAAPRGRPLTLLRTPLPRSDTASRISFDGFLVRRL
jgi:Transposase